MVGFIYNTDCPNIFSFDGHPSTFKFLEQGSGKDWESNSGSKYPLMYFSNNHFFHPYHGCLGNITNLMQMSEPKK